MVRFMFPVVLAVILFVTRSDSAITYRYRPLGGELKFVSRHPIQEEEYDNNSDPLVESGIQEQLMQLENQLQQQLQSQEQQQDDQQQQPILQPVRVRPFESFIRRWASIGNGYGRKITRSSY